MAAAAGRPRISKLTCGVILAVLVLLLAGGLWLYFSFFYQGRAISRFTGIANEIALPDCITSRDQIISISFHKDANGNTLKDVTYVCPDGKIYSQEYSDVGVFQGSIEWTYNNQAAER